MRAEQVTGAVAAHGEGPVWDAALQRLLWVDMLRGDVLSLSPRAEVERFHIGEVAACVVARSGGGYAVATERGFALIDADGTVEHLPDVWDDITVRMNDGACDPDGRFYCGSMAYDMAAGRAALYRLEGDRSVVRVLDGVTISNGLGWSPEGANAYYVDTPTGRIDVFDYDGELRERRVFVQIPRECGAPDGLTVDAQGGVWVALWGGAAVHRYGADGRLEFVVETPVTQPTSCTFGGPTLDVLYITSSAENVDEPHAGSLYSVQPGVRGLRALTFAG
jgi:sugar lactone lactonase YvrE